MEFVQAAIARYDNNGSTIKSWCVTTWSAVSAYAISERDSTIALVGLAIIIGFGIVELTYRRYQKRFIDRAGEMEKILKDKKLEEYNFSVHTSANKKSAKEIRSVLVLPHFVFFYLALGILSLCISYYCWIHPAKSSFLLKFNL